MAKLVVTLEKKTQEIEIKIGESVLEAALRQNIDAPYSCMEGVCTACLALVKAGTVDFPPDTILSDDEFKAGKILTCQAKVQAECTLLQIDYDDI